MNLTIDQIRELHESDAEKRAEDSWSLQAKYYSRPVSYRIAWVMVRLHVPASEVTILALLSNLAGAVLIGLGEYTPAIAGAALVNVGHLLDYADGTVARATGTVSKLGRYLDLTCDEVVESVVPVSVGVGLYISHCTFLGLHPLTYLVLGFCYALLHLLGATSNLHVGSIYGTAPSQFYSLSRGLWSLVYRTGVNVKMSAFILLLMFSLVPNGLPAYLIIFTLVAAAELALGVYRVIANG